jgi:hypothetical protein
MQEYEENLIKQQTYKTKKKPTNTFEAKYPKGQKLIETRCKNLFLNLKMLKVEEMNIICRRCKILEKQNENLD